MLRKMLLKLKNLITYIQLFKKIIRHQTELGQPEIQSDPTPHISSTLYYWEKDVHYTAR